MTSTPTPEKLTLEPCPFCGGTPELVTRDVEPQGDPWYGRKLEKFVLCDCGACLFDGNFHEGFWDAETRALEAWNRRTPAARLIEQAAQELRGECNTLAGILRDAQAVIETIEPENDDEAERLFDLRVAMAHAVDPYKREGTLL